MAYNKWYNLHNLDECVKNNSLNAQTGKLHVKNLLEKSGEFARSTLHNILRSKSNQGMEFGQLIEYNIRHIFVEKLYAKYAGETFPRPLSKKSKLSISPVNSVKF